MTRQLGTLIIVLHQPACQKLIKNITAVRHMMYTCDTHVSSVFLCYYSQEKLLCTEAAWALQQFFTTVQILLLVSVSPLSKHPPPQAYSFWILNRPSFVIILWNKIYLLTLYQFIPLLLNVWKNYSISSLSEIMLHWNWFHWILA